MGRLLIICVVYMFFLINVYGSSSFQEHDYILKFDDFCIFYNKCKSNVFFGGEKVDKPGEWENIVKEFISDKDNGYSLSTKKGAFGLSVHFREGIAFSSKLIVEQWLENVDLRHKKNSRINESTVAQEIGDEQPRVNDVGRQIEGPVPSNFLFTHKKAIMVLLFSTMLAQWATLVKLYLEDNEKTISEFDVKEFCQWSSENKWKTLTVSGLTVAEICGLVWLYNQNKGLAPTSTTT